MDEEVKRSSTRMVGAIVNGVAHIHQDVGQSVLDEDGFFLKTGLRLSWPSRVCLQRLLQEDVLLHDIRALIQEGALVFAGNEFSIGTHSSCIAAQRLAHITRVIDRVNPDLADVLIQARELLAP
jgi:hypothetical protein